MLSPRTAAQAANGCKTRVTLRERIRNSNQPLHLAALPDLEVMQLSPRYCARIKHRLADVVRNG
jgi:hypothetical protein